MEREINLNQISQFLLIKLFKIMKKQYFMMAIAATMFAACSQNEIVDEVVESTPKAIGFTTYAEGQTRAENSNQGYTWNLEDHHTTFKVWAYKNVADAKVFDGDVVSYADSKWGYTNTRYWDKAASWYEFYAAAPENFSWVLNENTPDKADDYFILNDYKLKGDNYNNKYGFTEYTNTFKDLDKDVDLMIADKKKITNEYFNGNVHLEFIHILSRLNITVKKDNNLTDTVNLVKLDVVDLKNIGNFNESNYLGGTLTGGITRRWTTVDNYTTITYDKQEEVTANAQYAIQALVIPQEAAVTTSSVALDGSNITSEKKPYIRIEYTITPVGGYAETFVAYYNLAPAFGEAEKLAFNEGWQNTLNITIAPTAITFDANVAPWGENNKDLTIK
jgi:hypothetical protein